MSAPSGKKFYLIFSSVGALNHSTCCKNHPLQLVLIVSLGKIVWQ